jgi:hypothetical protein
MLFVGPAFAENSKEDLAEYRRLSTEMEKLGRKSVWAGVERKFHDLQKLGVPIEYADYVLAAQAAQEQGDISTAKKRLSLALELNRNPKTLEWYEDLEMQFGDVTLISRSKDYRTLNFDGIVTSPTQAKAIEFAAQELADSGEFSGLLPYGSYEFGGQQFQLVAGLNIHLEISPHFRNKMQNKSND